MTNKKFSIEEQEILRSNPWVKNVTENSITYTEEFREHFILRYNLGISPICIFKEANLSPKILGRKRVDCCSDRFKRMNKRIDGFKDTRTINSGRPLENKLNKEETIEKLKNENKRLKQQLQFLKKMEFLAKQVKYNKSKQQKDIKQ